MALIQCAGADVLKAEIHMPLRGAWWANLRIDAKLSIALKTQVTIAASGGITLTGAVLKIGTFLDATHMHVVGGAGGIGVAVGPFAYQQAVLGDPLNAIVGAARETLSSTVNTAMTRLQIGTWTSTQRHAARLLDELCWVASQSLGGIVNWRTLGDGSIWIGQETWPSQSLSSRSDIIMQHPVSPWFEVACDTPSLIPGINLTDIGGLNVAGIDHWVEHDSVRSWVWTA
jgi:hypothetical protein